MGSEPYTVKRGVGKDDFVHGPTFNDCGMQMPPADARFMRDELNDAFAAGAASRDEEVRGLREVCESLSEYWGVGRMMPALEKIVVQARVALAKTKPNDGSSPPQEGNEGA